MHSIAGIARLHDSAVAVGLGRSRVLQFGAHCAIELQESALHIFGAALAHRAKGHSQLLRQRAPLICAHYIVRLPLLVSLALFIPRSMRNQDYLNMLVSLVCNIREPVTNINELSPARGIVHQHCSSGIGEICTRNLTRFHVAVGIPDLKLYHEIKNVKELHLVIITRFRYKLIIIINSVEDSSGARPFVPNEKNLVQGVERSGIILCGGYCCH
mmetsp:Transcript_15323/g.25489  ORF Transcript_15323/g.25489 Transcript_15323/m.25489 type:complete len:214 (-) Transcript_15323:172-813(-)